MYLCIYFCHTREECHSIIVSSFSQYLFKSCKLKMTYTRPVCVQMHVYVCKWILSFWCFSLNYSALRCQYLEHRSTMLKNKREMMYVCICDNLSISIQGKQLRYTNFTWHLHNTPQTTSNRGIPHCKRKEMNKDMW